MKVLFIGGTGNISASCVRLGVARGMDVFVLNRGQRPVEIPGARRLSADAKDEASLAAAVAGHSWDAVADFVAFTPEDVARDAAVFAGRTRQYLFISSASCYQKPLPHPFVTESTPLKNPVWQYSRDKIACEDRLTALWRERDFPMVIVRPSLTYATVWPIAIGGWDDFTLVSRMRRGGEVIVHGDGTSLWTVTHADDFAKGFVGLLGNSATLATPPHHLGRGADLGPDLPDDRRGRGRRAEARPHPVRVPGPGRPEAGAARCSATRPTAPCSTTPRSSASSRATRPPFRSTSARG